MTTGLLKLRAKDAEDIQVISAVLQDSIVPVCDMAFRAESKSFVLVAQRLRREDKSDAAERICCALTINGVSAAQTHGINQNDGERILDLLAILLEPAQETKPQQLALIFAGNAMLRLDIESWSATAEDFGDKWPASCNPCHEDPASNG